MPLYFVMFVSVAAYLVGMALKKKTGVGHSEPPSGCDLSGDGLFKGHRDLLRGVQ